MLRAGVIGVGNMGSNHARVYASLPGLCTLAGVYDPDANRSMATSLRFGVPVYHSLEQLLEAVDVVSVASPSSCHLEHALLALECGVHTLVEKPVTLNLAEARSLQAAVNRMSHSPVLQVGHIEHFNPAIIELRNLLQKEQVIAIDVQRLGPSDGHIQDMDVVQDLMIHDIHVILSIIGSQPQVVQAVGSKVSGTDQVDYAAANLSFDNGTIATLSVSRVTEEKIRRLSVTTRDAFITVDYLQRAVEIFRRTNLLASVHGNAYRQQSVVERVFVPTEEPLIAEISAFLKCVNEQDIPQVSLETGIQCLEVVDRVRRQLYADHQDQGRL